MRCQPRGRTTSVARGVASRYALPSGAVEGERAARRVGDRRLAGDDVRPRRRERVLEVRHEDLGPGVQGVDHHLRLGRAGDLDPSVVEVGRCRGDRPVRLADVGRGDEEVRPDAGVQLRLALLAPLQQVEAERPEPTLQVRDERERVGRQDPLRTRDGRTGDLDAVGCAARAGSSPHVSRRRVGRSPR